MSVAEKWHKVASLIKDFNALTEKCSKSYLSVGTSSIKNANALL